MEQQFLINAIRFETSHLKSDAVKQNVLTQLNRISNDVAKRVAGALGLTAPAPDPTFYHDNTTAGISIFNNSLPSIKTLQVGVLASINSSGSVSQAKDLKDRLTKDGLVVTVVGESLGEGIDQTYSAADATAFDGIVITAGAEGLFGAARLSALYPTGRPGQILLDGYRWGKPVGALGSGFQAFNATGIPSTPGVYTETDVNTFAGNFEGGLATFKFIDRFPLDS